MKLTKPIDIKTAQQLKDTYDNIYRKNPLKESDEHYRWALKVLAPEKGKRILDVACGGGYFLKEAEKEALDTFGIDISTVAIKIAKGNTHQSKIICGNGEFLPFRNDFFDYAINLGSLEHFLNPKRGIKEMTRVLKKGGKATLLLPNSYFLLTIWNVLRSGSTGRSTEQLVDRWATKEEWKNLIEEHGLKVEKVLKYNYKPPHASLKYKIMRPFIPLNLSYCFLFICSKP